MSQTPKPAESKPAPASEPAPEPRPERPARPPWTPWLIVDTVQVVLLFMLSYGAESRSGAFAVLALAVGYGGVKWHAWYRGTAAERGRLLLSALVYTLFAVGVVVGTFLRLGSPPPA